MHATIENTAGRSNNYIHRLRDENAELRQQLAGTREELLDLVRYLNSSKFDVDSTVQTSDVCRRLQAALQLTIA